MISLKHKLLKMMDKFLHPHRFSSEAYVKYLKSQGVKIGDNTYFFAPKNTVIDDRRYKYITIGSGCCITAGVKILCHDYSWSVLRKSHGVIFPDSGKSVNIGDNVFLGWNSIVLGGVTIGSNVIIGAYSVVTKDIPANVVCAGNPARIICSLEEYYQKKKREHIRSAKERAKFIIKTENRRPTQDDMAWFNVLWLDRNKTNEKYMRKFPFRGDDWTEVIETFYTTEKEYDSFDQFLKKIDHEI